MPEKRINDRIELLVRKWQSGQLSAAESAELDQWYNSFDDSLLTEDSAESVDALRHRLYLQILERSAIPASSETATVEAHEPVRARTLWPRFAAAASVLLVLAGAAYFTIHNHHRSSQTVAKVIASDVAPGGNKAILILANGSQIILDSAHTGRLAEQQNTAIEKTADGSIRYMAANGAEANGIAAHGAAANGSAANGVEANRTAANGIAANSAAATLYNTISTPRGGQYAVTLADGTKVILNAASSLRYPATFTGNDRSVQLSGEAWFEIAPDKLHPFIVSTGDQEVKVLGTRFNLNAYEDEAAIRTTLLSGSVLISNRTTHQSHSLSPGQQSLLTGTNLSISEADIEEATAWKNGYFMFESEDISSIMRKLARWYDVDIKFDGPRPTDKFNGTVQRLVNVSLVLKKLELTNKVHFNIDGRTIMVSK